MKFLAFLFLAFNFAASSWNFLQAKARLYFSHSAALADARASADAFASAAANALLWAATLAAALLLCEAAEELDAEAAAAVEALADADAAAEAPAFDKALLDDEAHDAILGSDGMPTAGGPLFGRSPNPSRQSTRTATTASSIQTRHP